MSLADVIARFATHATLTVTRRGTRTLTDGVWSAGATSTITLTSPSWQPYTGPKISVAPEGHDLEDVRELFCTTALQCVAGREDVVAIDGSNYTVVECKPHGVVSGGHFRAIIVRQNTP